MSEKTKIICGNGVYRSNVKDVSVQSSKEFAYLHSSFFLFYYAGFVVTAVIAAKAEPTDSTVGRFAPCAVLWSEMAIVTPETFKRDVGRV